MRSEFMDTRTKSGVGKKLKRWLRFLSGLVLLLGVVFFFTMGYAPPGILGEVIRHNQKHDIDASPLFYTEVENMSELETILWDRYYKEFLQLMIEQVHTTQLNQDTQDFIF